MKDKDLLRIEQLEESLRPYRKLLDLQSPGRGWVRSIREALGMTSKQLAARVGVKAPQTVEDMQEYEAAGTIKLHTLRKLAEALDCQLVYALVPRKPLQDIRRQQARRVARRLLKRVSHSMKLEDQGVSKRMEKNELDRRIEKLLRGSRRALWQ